MRSFLRYNSRHTIFFPRGFKDKWLPQLNPIMSSSHGKGNRRTWYLHEPLWLFHLRQRLFMVVGRQKCGRRGESHFGRTNDPLPDTWDLGPDGNRTCSYCGSIHPDDLMKICYKSLTDERYSIDVTDKQYKVYVRQPGVRNASEGAIKFYKHHAPPHPTEAEQEIFSKAIQLSNERFRARYMKKPAA